MPLKKTTQSLSSLFEWQLVEIHHAFKVGLSINGIVRPATPSFPGKIFTDVCFEIGNFNLIFVGT